MRFLGYGVAISMVACSLVSCAGANSPDTPLAQSPKSPGNAVAASANVPLKVALSTPARFGGYMSPAAKATSKLLYISDYSADDIEIYAQKGPNQAPIGELTGLSSPVGLAVASNGDLYVDNYGGNTVVVYHKGETTPYLTLSATDTSSGGDTVALDASGNVYVSNIPNVVEIFSPGATLPTSSLTDSNVADIYSIGVDSKGDVFDVGTSASAVVVDEFPAGSTSPTTLPIELSPSSNTGGLALDESDNLYVDDTTLQTVSEYVPPYTGSPVRKILYGGGASTGIAFDRIGKSLWLASSTALAGLDYTFQKDRLVDITSSSGLHTPYGIALSPPGGV
jgi:hypothetical protein